MLEISIIGVIALAAAYWTALWLMGRHEDVLHGDFIRATAASDGPQPPRPQLPQPLRELRRPGPVRAQRASQPAAQPTAPQKPAFMVPPEPAKPLRAAAARRPAQPEMLQSLLETIKRDLGDAVSR